MERKCTQDDCKGELILKSHLQFEDLGIEGEGIVSYWTCNKCDTEYQLVSDYELGEEYLDLKGENVC